MAATSSWGETTDPRTHDPQSFRYLVHALHLYELTVQERAHSGEADNRVDLHRAPERIAECGTISLSLIDARCRATWGPAGWIVELPDANVIITHPEDIGAEHANCAALERMIEHSRRLSPDALLEASDIGEYNEVVAFTNTPYGTARIVGAFVVTSERGVVSPVLAAQVFLQAQRLGFPIVAIAPPERVLGSHDTPHARVGAEGLEPPTPCL